MRSTTRNANKENFVPVDSGRPVEPMQLPHTRTVEIEMQIEDQQDVADVSEDLVFVSGPCSTDNPMSPAAASKCTTQTA